MDLFQNLKTFLKKSHRPLVVILGPTASGKTALSLKAAKELNGEIISADSRQIYKGMEIGTDMILPDKQEGIPHHLLAITTPNKVVSLAEYKEMAIETIKKIHQRKKLPILVGGTGLYISAITENYEVPRIKPNLSLRRKLQEEAKKKGVEFVHQRLTKLDPAAAKKIHPNNLRYVIRAIEINMASGKTKNDKKSQSKFDVYMMGINWPRENLYERINRRVDEQFLKGLVEEVKALLKKGYREDLPAMTSLGVKEIIPHVKNKNRMTMQMAAETLKRNIRHYAKRQLTWFKKYKNVNWLTPKEFMELVKPAKPVKVVEVKKVTAKKVAKKEVKKPVKKPAKKVVQKKKAKPVKKVVKKLVKKPVKKAKKPTKKSTKKKSSKKR
ncbi:MAG: tRNA (adenosine(37)-N6)-dimethylallyltransferase MiaA [Candidatus Gracilibacteria bacterium]|jgi:tRNA dimethylallyltransferase